MTSTDPAPNPHATAEQVEAARHDSKLAQVLYHDWEAESYDEKWSISYDKRCIDYARDLFDATVPVDEQRKLPYDRALELGCGSGFFLLNLIQAGVARRGSVTDLSPGMVKVATRNGENLGLEVDGRVADAEGIPYDDDTFDLVVGHAVLHHIPDVELSLREVVRVLKPGGRFVFAGEPTNAGETLCPPAVDADVAGGDERDQAAGARRLAAPAGRARRVVTGCRPGGDRRPAHLRARRPGDDGPQRRRRRRRNRHDGVHRGDAGLADPHLRGDGAAGPIGLGLGEVRVQQLDDAELGGRQRLAPRACPRAGSTTSWSPGSSRRRFRPRRRRVSAQRRRERRRCAMSTRYRLTDATRVSDIASVRTQFGEHAPVLVETVLLRRRAAAKFADPSDWLFTDEALQQATAQAGRRASCAAAGGRDGARRDLFGRHRACGTAELGRPSWSAATSTRYGWPWPGTTSAMCRCAAPTRCGPSPATPSCSPIPRAGGSAQATVRPARLHAAAGPAARRVPRP